jgi:hypothetical protein
VGEDMTLTSKSPVQATVRIIAASIEGENGRPKPAADVEASCEVPVSKEFLSAVAKAGRGSLSFHYFSVEPVNVQGELSKIREELGAATTDTLNLVRWSVGEMGPSDPLTNVQLSYSLDGAEWFEIGPPHLLRMSRFHTHSHDPKWVARLQAQLDEGVHEPIARALLREAWSSHFTNPRAALVLGVAALEVGTKDCIARLMPESTWLVDNMPAPNVHKMIKDYLPELLANRGNLRIYAPTRKPMRAVQTAVENRNTVVHRFATSEAYEKAVQALRYLALEETLLMVEEFLSLFDLYTGMPEARRRIRTETRQEMIDRNDRRELPEPDYGTSPNEEPA